MATRPATIKIAPNAMPAIRDSGIVGFAALYPPPGGVAGDHRRYPKRHPDQQPTCHEHHSRQRDDAELVSGCVSSLRPILRARTAWLSPRFTASRFPYATEIRRGVAARSGVRPTPLQLGKPWSRSLGPQRRGLAGHSRALPSSPSKISDPLDVVVQFVFGGGNRSPSTCWQ